MQVKLCMSFFSLYFLFHKSNSDIVLKKRKWRKCTLGTLVKNEIGAGEVRDVDDACKYDAQRNFYQEITWRRPTPTATPVTGYYVMMFLGVRQRCFPINSTVEMFNFTKYYGFTEGYPMMSYGVIALPVSRSEGTSIAAMKKAPVCPPALNLTPLPYRVARIGSKVKYKCEFEHHPVKEVSVKWHFSPDLPDCRTNLHVLENDDNIHISDEARTLEVVNIQKKHEGCYLLQVTYLVDERVMTSKGYLRINETGVMKVKADLIEVKTELAVTVGLVAGLIFVIMILLAIKFRFHRPKFQSIPLSQEPLKTVYVSHCLEEAQARTTLLQFVGKLGTFNINVIADILSEVQINADGGLSRWIPNNIARADKIIVLLSQSYIRKLTSFDSNNNESDAATQKIHAEYNYMTNILHNSLYKTNRIVLISKSVKPTDFPVIFQNREFFEFPVDMECIVNEYSDDNFRKLLWAILGKK